MFRKIWLGSLVLVFMACGSAFGEDLAQLTVMGKVGIGTTGPVEILDIIGNTDADLNMTSFGTDVTSFHIRRAGGSIGSPSIVSDGNSLMNFEGEGYDGTAYRKAGRILVSVDGTPGADDMPGRITFWTTPDGSSSLEERMRITNSGNVGIGATSPAEKLDVVGNVRIDGTLEVTSTQSSTGDITVPNVHLSGSAIDSNGSIDIVFDRNGDSTTEVLIIEHDGPPGTPREELFRVQENGNVGIGTTTPSQELHVQGDMRLTGALYDGNNEAGSSGQILSSTGAAVDWVNASTVGAIPAGGLMMWGGTIASIPSGYLLCDGSAVSRTTYANLFSAIVTIHGSGDGNTTFNLPDLRDKFVVGAKQDDSGVPKTNLTGSLTQAGGDLTTSSGSHGDHSFWGNSLNPQDPEGSYNDHTHEACPPYYAIVFIIRT